MRIRKTPMVKPVGLREELRLRPKPISNKLLAKYLGVDENHAIRITGGQTALTSLIECKLVDLVGHLVKECEGKQYIVLPYSEDRTPKFPINWSSSDVACVGIEEWREAERLLARARATIEYGEWDDKVELYIQLVCDPLHAIMGLGAALEREFGVDGQAIIEEAKSRHASKVVNRHVRAA